jgi:DNA-binding FadR family transcriptional regulator
MGDFHAAIAGAAAALAAARASENEVGRLHDIVDQLESAGQEAAQRRLDGRFSIEVAASAQSVRLTMQEIDLQVEGSQLPWPASGSAERIAHIARGHRAVAEAIASRDGDGARSVTESLVSLRTRWLVGLRLELGADGDPGRDRTAGTTRGGSR